MATAKQKPLTMKQAKFVKGIAEGKSATQSALSAYDVKNYGTAAVVATENLNKPNIKEAVEAEMAKQGITVSDAIAPIRRALADDSVSIQLQGSDRFFKLMGAHEKEETGGNTFIFNNKESSQNFTQK